MCHVSELWYSNGSIDIAVANHIANAVCPVFSLSTFILSLFFLVSFLLCAYPYPTRRLIEDCFALGAFLVTCSLPCFESDKRFV